ncbi:hypothetical protein ACTG9Q_23805 [Actinokineospora sp. 24-640]
MTGAALWPRRCVAAGMAALLSLLGVLAVLGGAASGSAVDEFVDGARSVDAVAPSRVVLVRHVVAPAQDDRVPVLPSVLDSGPPRRADLPLVALPAAPALLNGGIVLAAGVDARGPPEVSAP